MGEQLGLQGLAIPEEFGGSGYSCVELGDRPRGAWAGRCCAPPTSPPSCWPPTRCCRAVTRRPRRTTCPGIATGETIATLAFTEPSGKWDEGGITMEATSDGGGLHPVGHEDVRARRPHRQPDHRGGPHGRPGEPVRRRGRRRRPHPHGAVDHGPDPQAGQARVLQHPGPAARRRGLGLGRAVDGARPGRRSACRPRTSAGPRRCWRWPSSTPRSACSSAARSARSRPSSTSAPTCCSRSSRPSRPPTTACGARRR